MFYLPRMYWLEDAIQEETREEMRRVEEERKEEQERRAEEERRLGEKTGMRVEEKRRRNSDVRGRNGYSRRS